MHFYKILQQYFDNLRASKTESFKCELGNIKHKYNYVQQLHFKTFTQYRREIMSEETKEKIGEIIGGIVFGLIGWAVFYQYFFIGG